MNILSYTYEEFMEMVGRFHNYAAPGVVLGGYMVDLAVKQLPENILYDAISETKSCLPDAIQILTPCTIGNGWLRVYDLNLYALSLFDKNSGDGIRVFLDSEKIAERHEIKNWLYKLKPKAEQDIDLLNDQIKEAGSSVCSYHPVKIKPDLLEKNHKGKISDCPECKEPYPIEDGAICRKCQGNSPYV
ncbi:MAG: formylmethanofuran dehydrogenase subunit E family protein [Deltaproteobacteria bacterium]|nr:formylmethanofuran dehydrogenase subunit E family protein [Deltaproteobacteria bacterium]